MGAFFQSCVDLTKDDLIEGFEEFYLNGRIYGSMNSIFIYLISEVITKALSL